MIGDKKIESPTPTDQVARRVPAVSLPSCQIDRIARVRTISLAYRSSERTGARVSIPRCDNLGVSCDDGDRTAPVVTANLPDVLDPVVNDSNEQSYSVPVRCTLLGFVVVVVEVIQID